MDANFGDLKRMQHTNVKLGDLKIFFICKTLATVGTWNIKYDVICMFNLLTILQSLIWLGITIQLWGHLKGPNS